MYESRLVGIICKYINDEHTSNRKVTRVIVPTAQGEMWTWCLIEFAPSPSCGSVLTVPKFRMDDGEIFGIANEDTFFAGRGSFNSVQLPSDNLTDPSISETMSEYLRRRLAAPTTDTPFIFLRLKPEPVPLDAQSTANFIRRLTWLGLRSLSPQLANRKIHIEVGAQKLTITPTHQNPLVQFEADGHYFAAYQRTTPGNGVLVNAYTASSGLVTFTIDRDIFIHLIDFPSHVGYGYEFRFPIEFDVFLQTSHNAEQSFQKAIRGIEGIARTKLIDIIKKEIDSAKSDYIRRLDTRKARLNSRRRVYLGNRWLGYTPSNEHEVLIFAGKIEEHLASKVFSDFIILEHTPQIDIDGMLRVRRNASNSLDESALVEFEYRLDNFFLHRHPIAITNYIICWSAGSFKDGIHRFGAKGVEPDGALEVSVQSFGWIKLLKFHSSLTWVLVLEELPDLRFEIS